jgi:2-oxoglutarate dehydrogenase E2 component (dihydrolipoamide succinyltransferase)
MATLVDVRLPADQSEGTESVVATWFKRVGDPVRANEPLLEISTDKVTVEIAAPASGVLREILKADGEKVEPGELLGRIDPSGETAGGGPPARPPASGAMEDAQAPTAGEAELSPAVRGLLREHGLDVAQVKGSGKGGRITVQDVEEYLSDRPTVRPSRRVPHSPMRKRIARHMVESVQTAPHVTSVFEADLTAVMAHREAHRADYAAKGVHLTFTAYFVRATVDALAAVPEANSRWHEDALEIFEDRNIGVAVALEGGGGGLIVPVLHRAQELDLFATAEQLQDLTARARGGKLDPKDVRSGTITISNHGVSGSLLAAPIVINQPQSAILGVGKLLHRPVVRDGAVVPRPMVYVTLTIDHRALDGFQANAFLTVWVGTIESWALRTP